MTDVPRDLSDLELARWIHDLTRDPVMNIPSSVLPAWHWKVSPHPERARVVRALVEREVAKERASTREKVREAITATRAQERAGGWTDDSIVARVLGDHPSNASGGHEAEGREAPRG